VTGWAVVHGIATLALTGNLRGDPVELPATYGRRDGSGTPVDRPPAAVGRPHR